jgi:hypothetical protein
MCGGGGAGARLPPLLMSYMSMCAAGGPVTGGKLLSGGELFSVGVTPLVLAEGRIH